MKRIRSPDSVQRSSKSSKPGNSLLRRVWFKSPCESLEPTSGRKRPKLLHGTTIPSWNESITPSLEVGHPSPEKAGLQSILSNLPRVTLLKWILSKRNAMSSYDDHARDTGDIEDRSTCQTIPRSKSLTDLRTTTSLSHGREPSLTKTMMKRTESSSALTTLNSVTGIDVAKAGTGLAKSSQQSWTTSISRERMGEDRLWTYQRLPYHPR